MQLQEFLAPRVLIVSGKGGVGKTTVAAALALVAARHGRRVCVAEVDGKGALARLFGGGDLGYEPSELSPGVWGIYIEPERALAEYMEVQYHLKRLSRVFTSTHFVDYITTAAPGLKDILVLGKVWWLQRGSSPAHRHDFDTIVVDAPAAGHMLTFLSAPTGLSDAVRVGPIKRQAEWLREMLCDPLRTRIHLVTLPEEMPVSETLETSSALRDRLGIDSGVMFANGVYSELLTRRERKLLDDIVEAGAGELVVAAKGAGLELDPGDVDALVGYERFLAARRAIQARHLRRLRAEAGEPVVELPFLFSAGLSLPDVETLSDVIEERVVAL